MNEELLEKLGEFTGFLTIALFVLLGLRYILKAVFKAYGKKMDKQSTLYKLLVDGMGINKKMHPLFGYLTIATMLTHVYLQTGFQLKMYPSHITGLIAEGLMVLNILIGVLGQYFIKKPRPKVWLWIHRLLTVSTGVAILIHIN